MRKQSPAQARAKKAGAPKNAKTPAKKIKSALSKGARLARKLVSGKGLADSRYNTDSDPAHSPGHRKLNVKDNFTEHSGAKTHQQKSAVNAMANSDKIRRTNSSHRRVITGAALGKTGRKTA